MQEANEARRKLSAGGSAAVGAGRPRVPLCFSELSERPLLQPAGSAPRLEPLPAGPRRGGAREAGRGRPRPGNRGPARAGQGRGRRPGRGRGAAAWPLLTAGGVQGPGGGLLSPPVPHPRGAGAGQRWPRRRCGDRGWVLVSWAVLQALGVLSCEGSAGML